VNVDVVVDAGNSRIKWGRCSGGAVVEMATLKPAYGEHWVSQVEAWALKRRCQWVVCGSDPARQKRIVMWLTKQNQHVHVLDSYTRLPIGLNVKQPDKVGLDRLCNAVAVNSRRPTGKAAVVIDAGTAVTVDYVDEAGVFQGGAILPGLLLMVDFLHRHTAALPVIKPHELAQLIDPVALPGKSTVEAMVLGLWACFRGGVERVARDYLAKAASGAVFYIGGGDGAVFAKDCPLGESHYWPEMTLEGIRIAAEQLL
jgi:type III pantothenate kinase